jgi:FkbM family methyltransferase
MSITFSGTFTSADLMATFRGLGRNTFFVQVGAMDGVAFDPIHSLVRELGWHGILLEPMPDMFAKLKNNYNDCANLTFVNAAITDFDGHIEMTRIDPSAVERNLLPSTALGISTLMPERGALGSRNTSPKFEQTIAHHTQRLDVPCYALKTLLCQYDVKQIDLLVIDTEGADWMVARQLPLERYSPRVVYLEYNHLTAYEQVACAEHFRNQGYKIYIESPSEENFLAIKLPTQ